MTFRHEDTPSRTAGDIDVKGEEDMPSREDYDSAWGKIAERIRAKGAVQ